MTEPNGGDEPLRSLGLLEQYSVVRSQLGIYLNVCVTATYKRSDDASVPLRPAIFGALAMIIAKHPILSAVPVEIDTKLQFVRLDRIDLQEVVTFVPRDGSVADALEDGFLDKLLEKEHNQPFTQKTPLRPFWRLVVLGGSVERSKFLVCLCFHHALLDTKSAMVFHEGLEHALSSPESSERSTVVYLGKEKLLPPLESLLELPTSQTFIERQRTVGEPPAEVWSGGRQHFPSVTRFTSAWFSSDTVATLQKQYKSHGASLTALLMSLIARAIFHTLPREYTILQGDCAVSLRRFLPLQVTERPMGCYVGSFSGVYTRESDDVWDDAAQTKRTIDITLAKKGVDMPVGYLKHIPDLAEWFRGKEGKKRWAAWELSNVGTLGPPEDDRNRDYRIESVLFSQSASACSGAVKVSVATGRDGNMGVGFSWQQGAVEEVVIRELVVTFRSLGAQLVAGEDTCSVDGFETG